MDKICYLKRKRISTSSSSFVVAPTRSPVLGPSTSSSSHQEDEELIHEVSSDVADEIRRMENEIEELDLLKQSEHDEQWEFSPRPNILEPFPQAAKDDELKRSGMKRARMEQYAQILALVRPRYRAYLVERRTRTDLPEKPPKKGRGSAQPITKRPANGQRVRLLWNGDNCPVGSWGDSFNNYLGILARRADLWNIYYDWPSQPWTSFSATWRDLQLYFIMDDCPKSWDYVFKKIHKAIGQWRHDLKVNYFEKYDNDFERFYHLPTRVEPIHFAALMTHWDTDHFRNKSMICRENRYKNDLDHSLGSMSIANLQYKMEKDAGGPVNIDVVAKMAYMPRKKQRKGKENPTKDEDRAIKAKKVSDALAHEVSQATLQLQSQGENEIVRIPNAIQDKCVEAVFGKTKKDCRRLMGTGACRPERTNTTITTEPRPVQRVEEVVIGLQTQVTQMREFMLATLPPEMREKFEQTFPKPDVNHPNEVENPGARVSEARGDIDAVDLE